MPTTLRNTDILFNDGTTQSTAASTNALTATALQTARLIGGVSFNGTANINLPGVNTAGNQNTSGSSASTTGNAATATALQTARTINGVSFNGTANITINTMPVGATYIQFPGFNAPATVFGGTWSAIFDSEGIFFRTPGDAATAFGGGIQLDAEQLMSDSINSIVNGSEGVFNRKTTGGPFRTINNTSRAVGNGTTIGTARTLQFDNSFSQRTSTETRPRNRTVRVWVRTA